MATSAVPHKTDPPGSAAESHTVRVLIADDHEIMRVGVRALLTKDSDFQVCGEAANGREAVALAEKLRPDLIIIDLSMPELNGLDVIRKIKRSAPETEFLVLTGHTPDELVHQIFESGARSYLHKADAAKQLLPAVKMLAQHKPFFTSEVSDLLFSRFLNGEKENSSTRDEPTLTAREREIVQLLAEGQSNKQVSERLGISIKTAETHRAAIMRKLHLATFADLVRFAIRNKMIDA
jgi:DNA-binding NarL/FixJ family response regulator